MTTTLNFLSLLVNIVHFELTLKVMQSLWVVLLVLTTALVDVNSAKLRRHSKEYLGDHSTDGYGPCPSAQHTGFIDVEGGDLFYWLFESYHDPENAPLVVWLTGGPGCSSETAIFLEQGPYRVDNAGQVIMNEHAWNSVANMIFIDNPIGTGLSQVDSSNNFVRNEEQIATDILVFLTKFIEQMQDFAGRDLYLTGESYAGHYLPWIGHRLLGSNVNLNLKAVAIGNGWVNPKIQYPSYAQFAIDQGLITQENDLETLAQMKQECVGALNHNANSAADKCDALFSFVLSKGGDFNCYDVRIPCGDQPLCYDFRALTRLMNQHEVLHALGVEHDRQWVSCSEQVHQHMQKDRMQASDAHLIPLLENGIQVILYSGAEDFICNWVGGYEWTTQMQWNGQEGFKSSSWQSWSASGASAGSFKRYHGLTFIKVADAGHLVPMDQPERALELFKTFVLQDVPAQVKL